MEHHTTSIPTEPLGNGPVETEPTEPVESVDAGPAKRRTRRPGKLAAGVLAAVVLLGGGAWSGAALADPTASEEYAALGAEKASAAADRDAVQEKYDALLGEYNTLNGGIREREDAAAERESELAEREGKLKGEQAAVAKREKAVTGAEEEKEANTVSNGTWSVGVDIAPGTYRSDEPVDADCYWAIFASGSNGDIIENDIPGGGRPSVTLSKGQDFTSNRCGTWSKR